MHGVLIGYLCAVCEREKSTFLMSFPPVLDRLATSPQLQSLLLALSRSQVGLFAT